MIENKLNDLYRAYGYKKYRMTKFEPYELYSDNRDFIKTRAVVTFNDIDGELLALKPDVTLSIVKSFSGSSGKVYYHENVYRPRENHFREIPQMGIECLGHIDAFEEGEVIALAAKSLETLEGNYCLRISDQEFLRIFLENMGLMKYQDRIYTGLERKDTSLFDEMQKENIFGKTEAEKLKKLSDIYLPFQEGIEYLSLLTEGDMAFEKSVSHLKSLSGILGNFGVLSHIFLDFSLVNSMDYYNGLIFQGAVKDIPFSILNGGRYDRLPEKMGKKIGAIGFAIYLDTVENYTSPSKAFDADFLISYTEKDDLKQLAAVMERIISSGKTVRSIRYEELDNINIRAYKILSLSEALTMEFGGIL